jgi:hypothetical protein
MEADSDEEFWRRTRIERRPPSTWKGICACSLQALEQKMAVDGYAPPVRETISEAQLRAAARHT